MAITSVSILSSSTKSANGGSVVIVPFAELTTLSDSMMERRTRLLK
jgi:hypothetical protein